MKHLLLFLAFATAAHAQAMGSFHKLSSIPRGKTVFEAAAQEIDVKVDPPALAPGESATVTVTVKPVAPMRRKLKVAFVVRGVHARGPAEVVLEGSAESTTFEFKLGPKITEDDPVLKVRVRHREIFQDAAVKLLRSRERRAPRPSGARTRSGR